MIRVLPDAAVWTNNVLSHILLSNSLSKPDNNNNNNNSSSNNNQGQLY